jgi:hypothetical protein
MNTSFLKDGTRDNVYPLTPIVFPLLAGRFFVFLSIVHGLALVAKRYKALFD